MTDPTPAEPTKDERSRSFGAVASHYERFRPGPPTQVVDWFLPTRVGRVVDLGAGTGALTRLLVDRADDVVAVEPDVRMRAVLSQQVPRATVLEGRAESFAVDGATVDAVLASSSWHWVDPVPALTEVARALVPGGLLGVVWSGPDPDGPFMANARDVLAAQSSGGDLGSLVLGDSLRPEFVLTIPEGLPFGAPEHEAFGWEVALTADELIGMLGTLSWIITMPEDQRVDVLATARRLLVELLGVEGDVTVDVTFRADAWRARRDGGVDPA